MKYKVLVIQLLLKSNQLAHAGDLVTENQLTDTVEKLVDGKYIEPVEGSEEEDNATKAAEEKAAADKLAEEQAGAEKAASDKAEADKLAAEKDAAEKAAAEQAEADKIAAEKDAAEKAAAEQTTSGKGGKNTSAAADLLNNAK